MVKTLILLLLAPLAGFAQHSSDEKGPIPASLKPGTMFVNTYYLTDSSDALVKPGADQEIPGDDTQIVVQSGVHLYGHSDCVAVTGPGHPDTNIYSFAKNGDVYLLNTNRKAWDFFPFGLKPGKVVKTEPMLDTGSAVGHHYEMMDHHELYVEGHEKLGLDGTSYECTKLVMVKVDVFEGAEYKNATTYWYSPKIGYFLRAKFGWGGKFFLNQRILTYKPKSSAVD